MAVALGVGVGRGRLCGAHEEFRYVCLFCRWINKVCLHTVRCLWIPGWRQETMVLAHTTLRGTAARARRSERV